MYCGSISLMYQYFLYNVEHSLTPPSFLNFYLRGGEGGFSRPAPIEVILIFCEAGTSYLQQEIQFAFPSIIVYGTVNSYHCIKRRMSILIKPAIFIHCENALSIQTGTRYTT